MKQNSPLVRGKNLLIAGMLALAGSVIAQNPSVKVFEDWNTVSGTQNNFQRSIVRSKTIGGSTYYYTCGSTLNSSGTYDIFVQKKNNSGTVLWTQTYNGAGNGNDYGADVEISSTGSVYVCGTYYKNSTDSNNAIIIKYTSSGTQSWTYTYNGAGSRHDMFSAMQLSTNAVVAVGTTYKGSTNLYDMVVVRVDTSGSQVWTQTWDYTNMNDGAVNLWNNGTKIYIAGGAQSATTTYKYAVFNVKFSDGSIQGSTVTGGTAFGFDQLTDIQYDLNGYIYLTGGVINTGAGYDIKTVKLDTALNTIWSATYSSTGAYDEVGTGLALDQQGNVIVTGYKTSATTGKDYITIKYSSGGTQRWVSTFDGGINADDSATAIVVSPTDTNKIYVTGFSYNGSSKDYWTLKYDGAGNRKWDIGFNNIYNTDDRAMAIAIDSAGNIVVEGQNKLNDTTYDYTTVKYVEKSTLLPDDTASYTSSSFVYTENRGQLFGTDTLHHPEVKFYTMHGSPNVYFMDTAVSYVIVKLDTSASNNDSTVRVDMKFKNSNSDQKIRCMDVRSEYSNFFLGHTPDGRSRVQNYNQLISFNVWNNVDIVYGSNLNGLKYYFMCQPSGGSNTATQIDLKYQGADSVKIDGSGQLLIYTPLGIITQPKAAAWQLDGSGNYSSLGWQPSYTLLGTNEVGFTSFGSFNTSQTLVIAVDWGGTYSLACPNGVVWSTFMGGGTSFDQFHSVKTTASGDMYVAGETSCTNFPNAPGHAQGTLAGGMDAVVSKFFADGPLDWSSYYGGDIDLQGNGGAADRAFGVDVDASGNVYMVGETGSTDLVCVQWTGAYFDNTYACTGASCVSPDQLIVKLDPTGQNALWATYYGGNNNDIAKSIAISPTSGDIYVSGYGGAGFPLATVSGAYNGSATIGGTIIKFNSSGARIWATKLAPTSNGGSVESVTVDQNNDLVAVGYVASGAGFPIQNASGNTTYAGGQSDGFVTKFNGSGLYIEWSTFYGGDGRDQCRDVVSVQEGSNIFYYVVGLSSSSSTTPIPLVQPGFGEYYQGTVGGATEDGCIAQFHSTGALFWSTYMGGSSTDEFYSITSDSDDNLYITGETYSSNFPMPSTNAASAFVVTSLSGTTDALVVSFHKTIHNYVWGSYLGGSMADIGWGVACDGNTRLYVVGEAGCTPSFPLCQGSVTANGTPYYDDQATPGIGIKGFVSDLDLNPAIVASVEEPGTQSDFTVYPNPASQTIQINGALDEYQAVTIEICDLTGRIVYQETIGETLTLNKQIDVSTFAEGAYIVSIKTPERTRCKKVIIQR